MDVSVLLRNRQITILCPAMKQVISGREDVWSYGCKAVKQNYEIPLFSDPGSTKWTDHTLC